MKVRIAFRSDVVIEGDTIEEIREKWETMPLYSDEARNYGAGFLNVDTVEDADTYDDLKHEFY